MARVRARAGTRLGDGVHGLHGHAKSGRGEHGCGERSRNDAGGGSGVVGDDDEVENNRAGRYGGGDRVAGHLGEVRVRVKVRVRVSTQV